MSYSFPRISNVIPSGAKPSNTGQNTSYRTGDDASIFGASFSILRSNNPYNNLTRFTDEFGGTAYLSGILIDWSTYNGSTVLGWRTTNNGVDITWANAIDGALLVSIGQYTTGWRLPTANEIAVLSNYSATRALNYAPFSNATNLSFWTSTTDGATTTSAIRLANQFAIGLVSIAKTTSANYRYYPCRTFTVTGTTLT